MAIIADIQAAKEDAVAAVENVISLAVSAYEQSGFPALADLISQLRAQRDEILDQQVSPALQGGDLDAALTAMQMAAGNMRTVSANMTDVTGLLSNVTSFLGYGSDVVNALRMMGAPLYRCSTCGRTSSTPATCPGHGRMELVDDNG